MLPEVLQQQARLDDPQAAARRDFIRSAPWKALLHPRAFLPAASRCRPLAPSRSCSGLPNLQARRTFQFLFTGICSLCSKPICVTTLS